ncbi:MAG: carbamoyl-phosphate synthase large subunit [Frankiales bacterium]|nr:carbamoyl-phosphate synthase large subunit [Frankiales bacterium]
MTSAVLLSSAGRRVALMRCFRSAAADIGIDARILACDVTRLAPAMHTADDTFVVPRADDPAFIDAVLQECVSRDVRLVIPTIDPELPIYAAHADRFREAGTTIAVSSPETVAIGADKRKTHTFLTAHDIPTVRQADASAVLDAPGDWTFPVMVKPALGSAGIGVQSVASAEELAIIKPDKDLLVQERASGFEVTVDVFVDPAGIPRCAVPRQRLEVRAGEVSKAITVRRVDVVDLVTRLCTLLPGAFGALNVQVFVDDDEGQLRVIEINPRFGGGYPLTDAAGAHYARWLLQIAHGIEPDIDARNWRDGFVMLRYDDAVFIDASDVR